MAYEESLKSISIPTGADLSAAQYLFVRMTENGVVLSEAGGDCVGVVQNKPGQNAPANERVGVAATVTIGGVSKLRAGGVIAKGAKVSAMADGRGKAAAAGEAVQGVALIAATSADEIISVLLNPTATPIPAAP